MREGLGMRVRSVAPLPRDEGRSVAPLPTHEGEAGDEG